MLTVSAVELGIDLCAECWQFIDVVFTNASNSDPLAVRRSSEGEINEILRNNFTNNKTSLKNIVHTHISIIDWILCGLSTSDSVKPSVLKKTKLQNDCTFLFFDKHKAAHVLWIFHFMKIAKMFWQNQKTVLKKKNVYSFVSIDLRIVFKTFQKTDSLSKRLRTAIDANTDRSDDREKDKKHKKTIENKKTLIQNVSKKTKNKNPKIFQMKHRKRHELSSKKVICIIRIFEKKVASAASWWFTCKLFWSSQNFSSFEKTIFVARNSSKN